MKSKNVGIPDRAEVDRITEGAEGPTQSRIKPGTVSIIVFIGMLICFAAFIWERFFAH